MKKLVLAAAAATMIAVTGAVPTTLAPAQAQELRAVDWYEIHMIKWKQGKRERAHQIIELFEATDKALGRNDVMDFHMATGPWHSIVAVKMRGGIAEMGWKTNPDGEAWNKKFAEMNGGADKAKALMAEFEECMQDAQTHIGHIDVGE
jgi:hypothetical protein